MKSMGLFLFSKTTLYAFTVIAHPQFSSEQHGFITRIDWETHSPPEVRRRFGKAFPNAVRTPSVQVVKNNVLTELVERNENFTIYLN